MFEAVTEAIVLDKINQGEADSRVYLFTKDYGKISAKITSARKITSKLAAHFEPLNVVEARIIDKNGPLAVDGLSIKKGKRSGGTVKIMSLVKDLAAEHQRDLTLWNFLNKLLESDAESRNLAEALSLLGYDPSFARCGHCHRGEPEVFSARDLAFYCKKCLSEAKEKEEYAIN
ncbi:MAG: recombination protein O N-terminal domain-containing protein [Candidatus Pacebacteria bacterium]|nr:recombination protein O N-terminal domain-containing protein [Candidatus Paceibacterota bacterium]